MSFDIELTRKVVIENFNQAKQSISLRKFAMDSAQPISDVIPGYEAKRMEFGDFIQDNFSPLFIDIRSSTKRAMVIGPERTFISMHAFFPGVCNVIEQYGGYVIDFMGDGIMALFGGKESGVNKSYSSQQAGLCGLSLLKVVNTVINPLLRIDKIWEFGCGVGIDYGSVIVTKIGTKNNYDVKVFGDCVNIASKLSKSDNQVVVSDEVQKLWPSSKWGKMGFKRLSIGELMGYALNDRSD
ncbi:family 3 adenylate cyclase (plasmid) [Desulfosporosinus acidiphilus SJ4]|uniref:Family 3 adenylate cyclase n=1 Tax=Desulfosporosinus acidiphilus (strain DSM 22704 / JCM 16185 / SJ4) TaxID=646529 RepID=I4DCR0_DESAJ|nr:adenylate/guanylate cyclase domain-containing protein [Desulfosporosinus acidiphilus]AFM43584.1 family 3 adenylate cyclase [Desulfosporosinus acidiphilus SJ4]